jgi:hypothetical protein
MARAAGSAAGGKQMTKDEVLKLALEAGIEHLEHVEEMRSPMSDGVWLEDLEHFAALVAAHTLANIDPSKFMSYQEAFEAGRFAEREACAKVCDDINAKYKWPDDVAERVASQWCADAIRARGETK